MYISRFSNNSSLVGCLANFSQHPKPQYFSLMISNNVTALLYFLIHLCTEFKISVDECILCFLMYFLEYEEWIILK